MVLHRPPPPPQPLELWSASELSRLSVTLPASSGAARCCLKNCHQSARVSGIASRSLQSRAARCVRGGRQRREAGAAKTHPVRRASHAQRWYAAHTLPMRGPSCTSVLTAAWHPAARPPPRASAGPASGRRYQPACRGGWACPQPGTSPAWRRGRGEHRCLGGLRTEGCLRQAQAGAWHGCMGCGGACTAGCTSHRTASCKAGGRVPRSLLSLPARLGSPNCSHLRAKHLLLLCHFEVLGKQLANLAGLRSGWPARRPAERVIRSASAREQQASTHPSPQPMLAMQPIHAEGPSAPHLVELRAQLDQADCPDGRG